MKTGPRPCSEKQLRAVRFYMEGNSQAQSLRMAGYSEWIAADHPERVFHHPSVAAEIRKRQAELEKKSTVTVEYLLEKLQGIIDVETTTDSNKLRAIELFARHLGMLNDKLNVSMEQDLVDRIQAGRNRVRQEQDKE